MEYELIGGVQLLNFRGEKPSIKNLIWLTQGHTANLRAEFRPEAGSLDSEFKFAAIYYCSIFLWKPSVFVWLHKFTTDCPQVSPHNLSLFIPVWMS